MAEGDVGDLQSQPIGGRWAAAHPPARRRLQPPPPSRHPQPSFANAPTHFLFRAPRGHTGVHAYFENLSPGYVRRRCLPHISWRTCDVAIRASGLKYKALAAYLTDGVTWGRLRELATKAEADGGLGLFAEGSRRCAQVFGRSPSAIVENRPETDLNFLKLLEDKEDVLHTLASKDYARVTSIAHPSPPSLARPPPTLWERPLLGDGYAHCVLRA